MHALLAVWYDNDRGLDIFSRFLSFFQPSLGIVRKTGVRKGSLWDES